jgi:hypothetical protein
MADTKITALTANTSPIATDIMPMVDDPGGSAATQKITLANLKTFFTDNTYTDFTPTLNQNGTIAKTVNLAKWIKIGNMYHVIIRLNITGAGSATNDIKVGNLPAAPAGTDPMVGNYLYYDSGTGFYSGAVLYITATGVLQFYTHGLTNPLGTTPNIATANGDVLWIDLTYAT